MSKVTATYLYSGMSDFFSGYGCKRNQALLYAFYGTKSTLRDIFESAIEDFKLGDMCYYIPGYITEEDIRMALIDTLTASGRRDYEANTVSEFAFSYASANNFDVCRGCYNEWGEPHDPACPILKELIDNEEYPEDLNDDEYVVDDDDCDDDDNMESPIVVFLIEWEEDENIEEVMELCSSCSVVSPNDCKGLKENYVYGEIEFCNGRKVNVEGPISWALPILRLAHSQKFGRTDKTA